jgi:hypothetical protein
MMRPDISEAILPDLLNELIDAAMADIMSRHHFDEPID